MVSPDENDLLDDDSLPRQQNLPLAWDAGAGHDAEAGPKRSAGDQATHETSDGAPAGQKPTEPEEAVDSGTEATGDADDARPAPETENSAEPEEAIPDATSAGDVTEEEEPTSVYRLREADIPCEELLRDARERAGLTEEEAAARANVPKTFLITLEAGLFEELPEPHYVKTYVTRLCRAYRLNPTFILGRVSEAVERAREEDESGLSGRFQLAPDEDGVSGKVVYRLPSVLGGGEEPGRFWIRTFIGAALALVLLLAAVGFALQWYRHSRGPRQPAPAASTESGHVVDLGRYMPPQQLPLKEIPIP